MTKTRWMTTLIAAGLFACTSHADLLVYEGFDYNDGAFIGGLNGGVGWTAPWVHSGNTDKQNVRSVATMTYTDTLGNELPTTGLGYRVDRSFRGASRAFPQTYSQGVFWFSFLSRTTPVDDGVNNSAGMGFAGVMSVRNVDDGNGNNLYRLSVDGSESFTDVSGQEGNVHFFLVRYEIGTTTDDGQAHLWIDPLLNSEPSLGSADASLTGLDSTAMSFSTLSRTTPPTNLGPANFYDEVRLATDFASAVGVPTPASAALITVGGLAMLARRRR